MMVEIISYFHNYICVWIYENRVEDFAPCFWKIGQILYINMAMSHSVRALSASCTLKRSHNMLVQAVEVTANESNERNKAKFKVKLTLRLAALIWTCCDLFDLT